MIEKILNKIHEEQDGLIDADGNFVSAKNEGAYYALCDLEAYVESLAKESVSEDLEEAAYRYAIGCEPLRHEYGGYTSPNPEVEDAVIYGVQWHKEQMMKGAIEGVYDCDDDNSWIEFKGWAESISEAGCKVKVIIIKED